MPRAIWTGIVSFGLVSSPVRVVSAVQEKDVRFHQFHQSDGGRIRYRRVCDKDGKEVDYDDIARGYEVAKDRFVLISEEELEHLEPEKTRRIDIEQFVDVAEIDPITTTPPITWSRARAATSRTGCCAKPWRRRAKQPWDAS